MKCLVREVSSVQDYYKTNSIITCHQIRLHCSILLYSVWIHFCSFQFRFSQLELFLQLVDLLSGLQFAERYQSVPRAPPKVTGSKKSELLSISGRNLQEV